jgi:hypothetical protein
VNKWGILPRRQACKNLPTPDKQVQSAQRVAGFSSHDLTRKKPCLKSTPLAYAGIVGATFFWGTNFNAGAYIIKSMAPISASIERFSISTLLLVLIFGLAGKLRLSTLKNNLLAFIGLGLLGFTVFNLATFFGLQTTTPSTAH